MSPSQAIKLVARLKAAYPRQEIGEETAEIYADMLADLEFERAERSTRALLSRTRFFPTIAELREAYLDEEQALPSSAEAWELVVAEGHYPYDFDELPSVVRRALDLVGGPEGYRYSENMNALRSQFLRMYGELRDSAMAGDLEGRQRALGPSRPVGELIALPIPALPSIE